MAFLHNLIDIRSLRHVAALARRLSFARAADDLGISQSTLTRSIQALEARLNMRLFDRDRGGVALTPQAQALIERSALIVADVDDLERQLMLNARGDAGRIRFGMAPMPARALLIPVLAERLNAAPDVKHEVVVRDPASLWKMLVAGELEFFVCSEKMAADFHHAHISFLGAFPINLLARTGHPILADDGQSQTYPVLRSSWSEDVLPKDIRDISRDGINVIEEFGVVAGIVASSDALWLTSPYAATEEISAGILQELPRLRTSVRVVICSLERRSQSPLALQLQRALRSRVRTLATVHDAKGGS